MIQIDLNKFNSFISEDLSHLMVDGRKEKAMRSLLKSESLVDSEDNLISWNDDYLLYIEALIKDKAVKVQILSNDGYNPSSSYNKMNNVLINHGKYNNLGLYTILFNEDEMCITTNNSVLVRMIRSRTSVFYNDRLINNNLKRRGLLDNFDVSYEEKS